MASAPVDVSPERKGEGERRSVMKKNCLKSGGTREARNTAVKNRSTFQSGDFHYFRQE